MGMMHNRNLALKGILPGRVASSDLDQSGWIFAPVTVTYKAEARDLLPIRDLIKRESASQAFTRFLPGKA